MKFEKINENKLKIVFTQKDLEDKDLNLDDIINNPTDSPELVFDIIEEAEMKYGFNFEHSQLAIEGVSTSTGGLILTITKSPMQQVEQDITKRPKINAKRKLTKIDDPELIYAFNTFDNFADFVKLYNRLPLKYTNTLYEYNNTYYWKVDNLYQNEKLNKKINFTISEYAKNIPSKEFKCILNEHAKTIIKDTALQTIVKEYNI